MNQVKTLNIIGCGKVGKTISYLLMKSNQYKINNILTRSQKNSESCKNFLAQGTAISTFEELTAADVTLIAVSDDQLINVINILATLPNVRQSNIVFHCSGTFSSEVLLPLKSDTLMIASLHPLKSFSHYKKENMKLTRAYCSLEGDEPACKLLRENFEKLGANIVMIDAKNKIFYHIASIFSSNYLVTLFEIALQLLEQNQITREKGLALLEPLMMGTYAQLKEHGTIQALTGPISRGDSSLVAKQYQALEKFNHEFAEVYINLGKVTLDLAIKQNNFSSDIVNKLKKVLEK